MGTRERRGVLDRPLRAQRLALERHASVRPRRLREAHHILECREAIALGRERDPETFRLRFEPSRTDAEVGAAARQDVERRRRLDEHRRLPVDRAADERAELDARRARRDVPERRVSLEHRVVFGLAPARYLEEVIHQPEAREAGVLGLARDRREVIAERGGAA